MWSFLMILLFLLLSQSQAFFFPPPSGCSCSCPAAPSCAPAPLCAAQQPCQRAFQEAEIPQQQFQAEPQQQFVWTAVPPTTYVQPAALPSNYAQQVPASTYVPSYSESYSGNYVQDQVPAPTHTNLFDTSPSYVTPFNSNPSYSSNRNGDQGYVANQGSNPSYVSNLNFIPSYQNQDQNPGYVSNLNSPSNYASNYDHSATSRTEVNPNYGQERDQGYVETTRDREDIIYSPSYLATSQQTTVPSDTLSTAPFTLQSSQYSSITPSSAPNYIPSPHYQEHSYEASFANSATVAPTYPPSSDPQYEQPGEVYHREYHQVPQTSYDDTAPALPPPPPVAAPPTYKTTDYMTEARSNIRPASTEPHSDWYDRERSIHSGDTSDNEWPSLPMSRHEPPPGLTPFKKYHRRHRILKRMRTSKTMGAMIPRTNTTCNSQKLANIMSKAIVEDVSISKRMILRATELAFNDSKFDVFCAVGEFSYSIHSRKYCEVTKDLVTCFAFR